jgi:hypothetical protein
VAQNCHGGADLVSCAGRAWVFRHLPSAIVSTSTVGVVACVVVLVVE